MSILARLVALVLIAVLPALAIQAYNQIEVRQERSREVQQETLRLAQFAAGELDRIIESGHGLLLTLSTLDAVRNHQPEACSAALSEIKRLFPQYTLLGAVDLGGDLFCASTEVSGQPNIRDRPYFTRAVETGAFTVGDHAVGRLIPVQTLPLALPVRDKDGRITGIVFAGLDLAWLEQAFAKKNVLNGEATLAVADRQGTLLLRLPDSARYVGKVFADAYLPYVRADKPGTAEIVGIDGVSRILGYVPTSASPSGLYVGVGIAKTVAFAAIDRATQLGFALISTGLALALLAAWLGGRYFVSRPINGLLAAALAWRHGDFTMRAKVRRAGSEIDRLGRSFNKMAAELESRQLENAALLATLEERVADRTRELEEETAERRKAEAALLQAHKLEAVGQLTAGIAHDFNNLLTAIIGNLQLAQRHASAGGAALARLLEGASQAAERGAKLTQQLLAFGRRQLLMPQTVDLRERLTGVQEWLSRSVGPQIRISVALDPSVWPIRADPHQLELALLNLVLNARDAMPNGGTITIAARNAAAADKMADESAEFVLLSVIDTGIGMPPEIAARVFEPFYTTKEVGHGSGLGLSSVQGFALQSGGRVELRSAPNEGTNIDLWLPRAEGLQAEADSERPLAALERGAGRVLVCDDDPDVLALVTQSLTDSGYAVTAVESGAAALVQFDAEGCYAAAVLDFAMPEMNGLELAEAIRRDHPAIPILMISGYMDAAALTDRLSDFALLRKPFTPTELSAILAKIIAQSKGPMVSSLWGMENGDIRHAGEAPGKS